MKGGMTHDTNQQLTNVCACQWRHTNLEQLLIIQMIAGVQLEDEHVIDARLPPAPRVYGEQERHQHEQEDSAVDSDGDLELGRRMVCVEPCEHRPDPTLPSTRTNQGTTVNKLSKSVWGRYVVGM